MTVPSACPTVKDPHELYGKVPYGLILDGVLLAMTPCDIAVYLVLLAHNYGPDWISYPNLETIASLAPYTRRSVVRSMARLRALGVIEVEIPGGGRTNSTRYRICRGKGDLGVPVSNGDAGVTVFKKEGHLGRETGTPQARNSDARVTRVERRKEQQRDAAEDRADEGPRGEMLRALATHGIESPTLEQLVDEFPDMTVAMVSIALGGLGESARAGLKVLRLRERLPALIEAERQHQLARDALGPNLRRIERDLVDRYAADPTAVEQALAPLRSDAPGYSRLRSFGLIGLAQTLGGGPRASELVAEWKARAPVEAIERLVADVQECEEQERGTERQRAGRWGRRWDGLTVESLGPAEVVSAAGS